MVRHWLVDVWNENCGNLQKVTSLPNKLVYEIYEAVNNHPNKEFWEDVMISLQISPFLMNNRTVTFEWILQYGIAAKIKAGKYEKIIELKNKDEHSSDLAKLYNMPSKYIPNDPTKRVNIPVGLLTGRMKTMEIGNPERKEKVSIRPRGEFIPPGYFTRLLPKD